MPNLPFNIEDAARSEKEIKEAKSVCILNVNAFSPTPHGWVNCTSFLIVVSWVQAGETLVSVGQDIRLNNRVLDLRTPANLRIFDIKSQISIVRGYDFGLTIHRAFAIIAISWSFPTKAFHFDWIEVAL